MAILDLGRKKMTDMTNGQDASLAIDAEVLGDIDAWNVRRNGGWYFFDANLPHTDGARGYRRQVSGQCIIADTPGPVFGFLALGGSRIAKCVEEFGAFPYHVVAPGDEVGAVGMAGLETASASSTVETLTEQPQIAMTANAYLSLKRKKNLGLPLIIARAEHDESTSVSALRTGIAFKNLITAAQSISDTAHTLGKRARVLVVSLDFVLEDVSGTANQWATEILAVMQEFEKEGHKLGYSKVHFVSVLENADIERIDQQSRLGLFSKAVSFTWLSPSYAFERDHFFRTTETGMRQKARFEAIAISKILASDTWICPMLLLAEWDEKKRVIRVSTNAATDLELDEIDPFSAGEQAGFAVQGAAISNVEVDANNKREILVSIVGDLPREAELLYAVNGSGALRDVWSDGTGVHRWALPARLKIGQNPANFDLDKTASSKRQTETIQNAL